MKHRVLIVCLVLAGVLANPRPASAGLWAWLERFSGPGPFTGYPYLFTYCFQKIESKGHGPAKLTFVPSPVSSEGPDKVPQPLSCVYFDQGTFTADRDDLRGF